MTTFNTDYNNTELLEQELTIEELECVAGGFADLFFGDKLPLDVLIDQIFPNGARR